MSGTKADAYVTVAKVGEIPPGGVKVSRIGDQEIAVLNVAGAWPASHHRHHLDPYAHR